MKYIRLKQYKTIYCPAWYFIKGITYNLQYMDYNCYNSSCTTIPICWGIKRMAPACIVLGTYNTVNMRSKWPVSGPLFYLVLQSIYYFKLGNKNFICADISCWFFMILHFWANKYLSIYRKKLKLKFRKYLTCDSKWFYYL